MIVRNLVLASTIVALSGCERTPTIDDARLPTISFEVGATDIPAEARLSWTARNVSRCEAAGAWSGTRATVGSEVIRVSSPAGVYELHCAGERGFAVARIGSASLLRTAPQFPLRWSENGRYLVDAQGRPFLIHGDSAWSLIADLTTKEAEIYLDERRARGFNTLLVNLIEHKFAHNAPRNANGAAPFAEPGSLERPNDAYFDHAERVVQQAAERGLLVLLVPAYLGYNGQDEGWYREIVATPPEALRDYGRYLGRRFQKYANVIWVYGGDFNPPDRSSVNTIAAGIREFDRRISTAHTAPETSARAFWGNESWLQLNSIYTYKNVPAQAAVEYARSPSMPFFLLESSYENEQTADPGVIRAHAYEALLSGAAGHMFGNNPIWHFSGPGLFPHSTSWQESLDSPGARNMMHLRKLFDALPWWTLVPDFESKLIHDSPAGPRKRSVAAVSADRRFALVYFHDIVTASVDTDVLDCSPRCRGTWFDPSTGTYGPSFDLGERRSVQAPARSGRRGEDWLLLIERASG